MARKTQHLAYILSQIKGGDQILPLLQVVKVLVMRYGRKLTLPVFLQELEKIDADLAICIRLLVQYQSLQVGAIDLLIRALRHQVGHAKVFSLASNDEDVRSPLEGFLQQHFGDIQIAYQTIAADTFSVKLKGEGYIFSRSLEKDLDKLLA